MAAGILVPVLYLFQRLLHDAWVLLCGHGIERIGHTRIEIIPLEPDQRLYLRREASPISYLFSLREGQIILNANTHSDSARIRVSPGEYHRLRSGSSNDCSSSNCIAPGTSLRALRPVFVLWISLGA